MCQCMSFLIRNIVIRTCHSCRRLLHSLYASIQSCHLRFVSPEVNLFSAARLQNANFTGTVDDIVYLRTYRRMGACLSTGRPPTRRNILSQKSGKLRWNAITSDLDILTLCRKDAAETSPHYTLKGASRKMCKNAASNVASLFTQQGRKGINQDAMIVWEGCGDLGDIILCGVLDGHGPSGHLVAQNVRDSLPPKLVSIWQAMKRIAENAKLDSAGKEPLETHFVRKVKEEGCSSEELDAFSFWRQSILSGYRLMDIELRLNPTIDCFCSGTTAVTLIKQGKNVIIGNIGDSRAVLGTKSDDGSMLAVQLTVDFKPDLPQEAERIRKCKGRVFALHDEPDVYRVWLPHQNTPGLAMARAFGDFCLKNFGVIAVPEVIYRRLTENDQFIVLATDGIWDVLSNEQVVEIVFSLSARQLAARALVDAAVHAWRSKYPTSKVDDCAVVCLYVDHASNISCLSDTQETDDVKKTDILLGNNPNYEAGSQSLCDEADNQNKHMAMASSSVSSSFETMEDEWSALEGINRVNSLVNLPRFSSVDKEGGSVAPL